MGVCLGLGSTVAVGSLFAQESPEQEESATPASSQEMLKMAQVAIEDIEGASRDIAKQQQEARRERDVVRVLCLSDKLGQIDVALRSAKARSDALSVALDRDDLDRAHHESLVMGVLAARVKVLVGESSQCVGEETGFIGEAEVNVSIDPNLPDDSEEGVELLGSTSLAPPSIGSAID